MSYERFSQLWDALITNNPRLNNREKSTLMPETEMSPETKKFLTERAQVEWS